MAKEREVLNDIGEKGVKNKNFFTHELSKPKDSRRDPYSGNIDKRPSVDTGGSWPTPSFGP